jgi:hypothetical protein
MSVKPFSSLDPLGSRSLLYNLNQKCSSLLSNVHNAIHVALNFTVEIRGYSNSLTAQDNPTIPNMYASVPKSWIVDETMKYRKCVQGKSILLID